MKRVISFILLLSIIFSLCGCDLTDSLVNTEREVVDVIVLSTPENTRWGYKYLKVGYGSTTSTWLNTELHNYYLHKHGATFPAYLITYTYESGKTMSELLFNEDLWKEYINEDS